MDVISLASETGCFEPGQPILQKAVSKRGGLMRFCSIFPPKQKKHKIVEFAAALRNYNGSYTYPVFPVSGDRLLHEPGKIFEACFPVGSG
jgi:hypothetical protein